MKRARLPLTALRSFEAAGRHLSFSRVAEKLFVSQAAIRRQIRELETFQPLFERPIAASNEEIASGALIKPFDIDVASGAYWLVARSLKDLPEPAKAFADWVSSEFAESRRAPTQQT